MEIEKERTKHINSVFMHYTKKKISSPLLLLIYFLAAMAFMNSFSKVFQTFILIAYLDVIHK